jgi:hypothetical protein
MVVGYAGGVEIFGTNITVDNVPSQRSAAAKVGYVPIPESVAQMLQLCLPVQRVCRLNGGIGWHFAPVTPAQFLLVRLLRNQVKHLKRQTVATRW